ncbi:flagellar type III secretion system pore protein FliP [bacterium]|nr:flagellar type III secretion system pore protein FliP [bacterium]
MKLKIFLFSFFLFSFILGADNVLNIDIGGIADTNSKLVGSLNILILFTLLTLAPSLIFMMTAFTRIVIVMSIFKQAIGAQQILVSNILISLAIILTFFVMKPVFTEAYNNGINPYIEEKIDYKEALEKGTLPFKKFMMKNTREEDLALFLRIAKEKNPKNETEVSISTLIPAFMLSEIKTAFEIGIMLYIPMVVIDLAVSSVLMSLGLMMLPPTMISMPIKIAFIILIDGFSLLLGNLAESFTVW